MPLQDSGSSSTPAPAPGPGDDIVRRLTRVAFVSKTKCGDALDKVPMHLRLAMEAEMRLADCHHLASCATADPSVWTDIVEAHLTRMENQLGLVNPSSSPAASAGFCYPGALASSPAVPVLSPPPLGPAPGTGRACLLAQEMSKPVFYTGGYAKVAGARLGGGCRSTAADSPLPPPPPPALAAAACGSCNDVFYDSVPALAPSSQQHEAIATTVALGPPPLHGAVTTSTTTRPALSLLAQGAAGTTTRPVPPRVALAADSVRAPAPPPLAAAATPLAAPALASAPPGAVLGVALPVLDPPAQGPVATPEDAGTRVPSLLPSATVLLPVPGSNKDAVSSSRSGITITIPVLPELDAMKEASPREQDEGDSLCGSWKDVLQLWPHLDDTASPVVEPPDAQSLRGAETTIPSCHNGSVICTQRELVEAAASGRAPPQAGMKFVDGKLLFESDLKDPSPREEEDRFSGSLDDVLPHLNDTAAPVVEPSDTQLGSEVCEKLEQESAASAGLSQAVVMFEPDLDECTDSADASRSCNSPREAVFSDDTAEQLSLSPSSSTSSSLGSPRQLPSPDSVLRGLDLDGFSSSSTSSRFMEAAGSRRNTSRSPAGTRSSPTKSSACSASQSPGSSSRKDGPKRLGAKRSKTPPPVFNKKGTSARTTTTRSPKANTSRGWRY